MCSACGSISSAGIERGAERIEGLRVLALRPLTARDVPLEVALRHVVAHDVPGDVPQRVRGGVEIAHPRADDHAELHLPVDLGRSGRHADVVVGTDDRVRVLVEQDGVLRRRAARLGGVGGVVLTDAEDRHRAGDRRADAHPGRLEPRQRSRRRPPRARGRCRRPRGTRRRCRSVSDAIEKVAPSTRTTGVSAPASPSLISSTPPPPPPPPLPSPPPPPPLSSPSSAPSPLLYARCLAPIAPQDEPSPAARSPPVADDRAEPRISPRARGSDPAEHASQTSTSPSPSSTPSAPERAQLAVATMDTRRDDERHGPNTIAFATSAGALRHGGDVERIMPCRTRPS